MKTRCGIAGVRGGLGRARARRGFTLIEVMIVIAIILALSGLVAVALFGQRDKAKTDTVRIQMNNIRSALDFFRLDYDRYPKDEEGIAVLWDKSKLDPEADATKWHQYLKESMPNDGWGHPWGYKQQSEHTDDTTKFDLWSYGPDGQDGTDDDIKSWTEPGAEGGTGADTGVPAPKGKGG
jgi:general secretion pathway protein G